MPEHRHTWRLKPPNGPVTQGKCRCGARRDFPNSTDRDFHWMKERFSLTAPPAGGRRVTQ